MNNRRIALVLAIILAVVFSFNFYSAKTDISGLYDQQFYTELISLDGIGPILAKRIIDYRHKKPYATPDEYIEVKGIGEEKVKLIKSKFK